MLDKERVYTYFSSVVIAIGFILILFGVLNEDALLDVDRTVYVMGLTITTLGLGILVPNAFKLITYKPE